MLTQRQFNNRWMPAVDQDFIAKYTSIQLADGDFVQVPIISGANSDEGTAFSPVGINTTTDFRNTISSTSRYLKDMIDLS